MSGTITGSNPGWVAGYVPPAGEWNSWWAKKLDVTDPVLTGGPFVSLGGDTMTGPLYLPAPMPTQANQAVSKAYVDSLTFAVGPFMPLSGGTFSGPVTHTSTLTLMGNPSGLLDAAPKQYVDAVGQTANSGIAVANAAVRRAGDTMTGLLVLSADPVNALGAVTKQYADTKLALAGGTVTGNFATLGSTRVDGGLYSSTTFLANAFNNWEWSFSVNTNGDKIQTYRTGWYDVWNGTTGTRSWVGGNNNNMTLDGSGNLNILGTLGANVVVGNTVFSNGNANVAGTLGVGALTMGPWVLYNNGNQIQQHTTGWYDEWVTATGQRNWVGGNVTQMSLDPAGNLNVRGSVGGFQVNATDAIVANGNLYARAGDMVLGVSGSVRLMQMAANWYWGWDSSNGNVFWNAGGSGVFWAMTTSDHHCSNVLGPVAGVGAYVNNSDERAKDNIAPAPVGLDEVLALRPIRFTRVNDGRNPDEIEIGFSAQQVRSVIPEAVRQTSIPLPEGAGGGPSLGVSIDPIVAALVLGMQELAAELATLKARPA